MLKMWLLMLSFPAGWLAFLLFSRGRAHSGVVRHGGGFIAACLAFVAVSLMVIPGSEWHWGKPAHTKVDKLDVRSARPVHADDGRDEERRYGLSQSRYEQCKALGLQVMLAQRKEPDGPQHAAAYAEWDSKCGLQVLLPYAKAHRLKNVPAAPLEWTLLP